MFERSRLELCRIILSSLTRTMKGLTPPSGYVTSSNTLWKCRKVFVVICKKSVKSCKSWTKWWRCRAEALLELPYVLLKQLLLMYAHSLERQRSLRSGDYARHRRRLTQFWRNSKTSLSSLGDLCQSTLFGQLRGHYGKHIFWGKFSNFSRRFFNGLTMTWISSGQAIKGKIFAKLAITVMTSRTLTTWKWLQNGQHRSTILA